MNKPLAFVNERRTNKPNVKTYLNYVCASQRYIPIFAFRVKNFKVAKAFETSFVILFGVHISSSHCHPCESVSVAGNSKLDKMQVRKHAPATQWIELFVSYSIVFEMRPNFIINIYCPVPTREKKVCNRLFFSLFRSFADNSHPYNGLLFQCFIFCSASIAWYGKKRHGFACIWEKRQ